MTTIPERVMAVDPSLSGTAVAAFENGKPLRVHHLTTKASYSLAERVMDLALAVRNLALEYRPPVVLVEGPSEHIGKGHRRSNASLPHYGLVVGATAMALEQVCEVLLVPVSAWSHGRAGAATKKDPKKLGRIRHVEDAFGLNITGLIKNQKSRGDVADACMLAEWWHLPTTHRESARLWYALRLPRTKPNGDKEEGGGDGQEASGSDAPDGRGEGPRKDQRRGVRPKRRREAGGTQAEEGAAAG